MKNQDRWSVLETVLAVVLLSSSGICIRMASIDSGAMAFIRTSVPSAVLGLWFLMRRWQRTEISHFNGRRLVVLILASLLNAARLLLIYEAFGRTSMGNVVIVLYTWPVFAMLFGVLLLKESINVLDSFFISLAFFGMIVVYSGAEFSFANDDFVGMSITLCSAICYALMFILIRREKVERIEATFWQNIAGAFVFLPAVVHSAPSIAPSSWGWAIGNGILVGIVAFALFFKAMGHLSASLVGHIAYLEVIFTFIWGRVIFNEPITWRQFVGGGLIVLSMAIRADYCRRIQPQI